jgi:hypothetical protein
MAGSTRLKEAKALVSHLEGIRKENEDVDFKKISEALLPQRGFWPSEGDNKRSILQRGAKNINPIATLSLERAAGGLTTGMTPEGQPWFGLRTEDGKLMEAPGVREHLGIRERLINTVLRTGRFYQAIHTCNIELLGFGGLLLFCDRSNKTIARFEDCTVGTYCVAHDSEGDLDTVTRRIKWTAKQIKKKYGEQNMSKKSRELLTSAPYQLIDVVHVVTPREKRDDTKIDNLNMAYSSIMYEDFTDDGNNTVADVLRESGYPECPYFYAPYANVGASEYGMGAGHLLVNHHDQLNETERQKTLALQKMINPPMKKPAAMKGRLNIGPGQENVVSSTDFKGVTPIYEVPIQGYEAALVDIKDIMGRIEAVSKADLFITMSLETRPPGMTATEYMGHERKKLQQVAPFISIYEPRVLDKVITRLHNMLDRMGAFPPPPQALIAAGAFEIIYTSSIAKSLRQVGAETTRTLLADVAGLADMQVKAGMKPTALIKVDIPQAVDEISNGLGSPARLVLDDAAFEEKLAEMEEQEAAERRAAAEAEGAEQLAKVGSVSTQGTVAGQMMEGMDNG